MIGNCKALSGNEGYSGTASIKDTVFLYVESSDNTDLELNINFLQKGKLLPKLLFNSDNFSKITRKIWINIFINSYYITNNL